MLWYLALETSSAHTSLCLCSEVAIHEKTIVDSESHSETLALSVQALIAAAGIKASDICAIIVAAGPGSFTGLRIGFSFAKGLAMALSCPLHQISSLAAAAAEFSAQFKLLFSLRDARRDELFWEAFRCDGEAGLLSIGGPGIVPVGGLKDQLEGLAAKFGVPATEIGLISADDVGRYGLKTLRPQHSARQLVILWKKQQQGQISAFNLGQLIELEPWYMRAVAAKTIAERSILPG